VYHLNEDVAGVVKDIVDAFDNGKIHGILVLMKQEDETWVTWSGLSYMERQGAVRMLEEDVKCTDD
jgi:hypothetical protein